MPLSEFHSKQVELIMDDFMTRKRPPEKIRNELDIGYRIENQSVVIFEVRPVWNDPKEKIEEMVAKTTYVQKTKTWKLYWQRADLKWHSYEPNPEVKDFEEFVRTVEEDEFCCFWG